MLSPEPDFWMHAVSELSKHMKCRISTNVLSCNVLRFYISTYYADCCSVMKWARLLDLRHPPARVKKRRARPKGKRRSSLHGLLSSMTTMIVQYMI